MFRARAKPDETRGKLAQNWKPLQQTEHEWKRSFFLIGGSASDDSTMNKDLHSLDQASWPFAARLYFSQVANVNWTALQLFREQVCGRNCVLDSKVDSYTARR
jgi:diaminopimelate decarboxylase